MSEYHKARDQLAGAGLYCTRIWLSELGSNGLGEEATVVAFKYYNDKSYVLFNQGIFWPDE